MSKKTRFFRPHPHAVNSCLNPIHSWKLKLADSQMGSALSLHSLTIMGARRLFIHFSLLNWVCTFALPQAISAETQTNRENPDRLKVQTITVLKNDLKPGSSRDCKIGVGEKEYSYQLQGGDCGMIVIKAITDSETHEIKKISAAGVEFSMKDLDTGVDLKWMKVTALSLKTAQGFSGQDGGTLILKMRDGIFTSSAEAMNLKWEESTQRWVAYSKNSDKPISEISMKLKLTGIDKMTFKYESLQSQAKIVDQLASAQDSARNPRVARSVIKEITQPPSKEDAVQESIAVSAEIRR